MTQLALDDGDIRELIWLLQLLADDRVKVQPDAKEAAFRLINRVNAACAGAAAAADAGEIAADRPAAGLVRVPLHSAYRRGPIELWLGADGTAQFQCAGSPLLSLRDLRWLVAMLSYAAEDLERETFQPASAFLEGDG